MYVKEGIAERRQDPGYFSSTDDMTLNLVLGCLNKHSHVYVFYVCIVYDDIINVSYLLRNEWAKKHHLLQKKTKGSVTLHTCGSYLYTYITIFTPPSQFSRLGTQLSYSFSVCVFILFG